MVENASIFHAICLYFNIYVVSATATCIAVISFLLLSIIHSFHLENNAPTFVQ